jgi:hypothetical protein
MAAGPFGRERGTEGAAGGRQVSPSALRNIPPILEVLGPLLPESGRMLEIASGTGQHVRAFAEAFPHLAWLPSDPDPFARASIAAYVDAAGRDNLRPPLALDVTGARWWAEAEVPVGGLVAVNLLHISPWAATCGLMAGAGHLLGPGGLLFIYGCFKRDGAHISPSNADFDGMLRARDPRWGVRDIGEVAAEAGEHGLRHAETVAMPANNFSLIFRRV